MDWAKVAEWTALAVGVVAGLFLGLKEWKERKARSNGLAPNPTRCEDHETRLRESEKIYNSIVPKIENLDRDVTEIKADVKSLIHMHLKN